MSEARLEDTSRLPAAPRLCEFAGEMTAQRLDKMISFIEGVRKAEDIEAVHQMRVWSRRSRAALEMFRVCFKDSAFVEVEREVKAATDALSEARDLDVMTENLENRAEKLPVSQRAGVEAMVSELRKMRDDRQQTVAKAVTDLESHNLAQHFRELVEAANQPRPAKASRKANLKNSQTNGSAGANGNGKGGRRRG